MKTKLSDAKISSVPPLPSYVNELPVIEVTSLIVIPSESLKLILHDVNEFAALQMRKLDGVPVSLPIVHAPPANDENDMNASPRPASSRTDAVLADVPDVA